MKKKRTQSGMGAVPDQAQPDSDVGTPQSPGSSDPAKPVSSNEHTPPTPESGPHGFLAPEKDESQAAIDELNRLMRINTGVQTGLWTHP